MMLSVIIPVFNERSTVLEVIRRVRGAGIPAELEIVVIDDGSTDGTSDVLLEAASSGVRVHRAASNGGKGIAVRKGIELARGEWIVIQDADLELDPADLPALWAAARTEPDGAAYGSRFQGRAARWRSLDYWGNRALTAFANLLFGSALTDMLTGYKLFPASFLRAHPWQSRGFEIEAELTARALGDGLAVREVPVRYTPRTIGQGKKGRRRHGLRVAATLLAGRLAGLSARRAPGSCR